MRRYYSIHMPSRLELFRCFVHGWCWIGSRGLLQRVRFSSYVALALEALVFKWGSSLNSNLGKGSARLNGVRAGGAGVGGDWERLRRVEPFKVARTTSEEPSTEPV